MTSGGTIGVGMMIVRMVSAFLWIFAGLSAAAQESDGSVTEVNKPERATYFLIDSSGSMQRKDTESKVQEILQGIVTVDEAAPVSRTYFRADGGDECWKPISIGPMTAASESRPNQPPEYRGNVFTPSGEALKAALLAAITRGGSADIFIVSDEDPTPGCGVEICSVAASLLPLPGIHVQSIQVDSDAPARRDTMGCLAAAQFNSIGKTQAPTEPTGEPKPKSPIALFLEKWLWLMGFISIYILSFWFGWANQNKAIKIESDNEDIRALERASLIEGNEQAQKILKGKLEEIKEKRASNDEKRNQRSFWEKIIGPLAQKTPSWQIIGCIVITGFLFWIAATDHEDLFGLVETSRVRASAWEILDTDFATAFAAIWIVSLFYSGSQVQRRKEAEANFAIVSREAEWSENAFHR